MKRSCGRGQRVEEDREEMGQKLRRKGRKRQLEEGKRESLCGRGRWQRTEWDSSCH